MNADPANINPPAMSRKEAAEILHTMLDKEISDMRLMAESGAISRFSPLATLDPKAAADIALRPATALLVAIQCLTEEAK